MPDQLKKHELEDSEKADRDSYGLPNELVRNIQNALDEGDNVALQELISPLHAADFADLIDVITHDRREQLVRLMGGDFDPEVLVDLSPEIKEEILELLGSKATAAYISQLDTDDAVQVVEDLDEREQQEILEEVPEETRVELEEGLAYPDDSAGRLLDKNLVSVPEFWTVGQTIDFLREEDNLPEDFYQIFVVDPKYRPVGYVRVSRIMRNKRPVIIKDIMDTDVKIIHTDMDQEEMAFIFRQYGLAEAPVINDDGRMIGVVSVDDIVDVIHEEAEEDILRMSGLSETDIHASFGPTTMRRLPWLVTSLFTAILVSLVIGIFEETIQKLVALAVLMPIIAAIGANGATQTATVVIRAIAMKELTPTNRMRVIIKELAVGGANGIFLGIVSGVTVYVRYDDIFLSVVFAAAMYVTMVLAGLAGAIIPLLLRYMRADPAVASGVFVTTVTDVVSFGCFLGFASLLLV